MQIISMNKPICRQKCSVLRKKSIETCVNCWISESYSAIFVCVAVYDIAWCNLRQRRVRSGARGRDLGGGTWECTTASKEGPVDQVPARRTDSKQESVVCALVAVFAVAQYTVCIVTCM